MRIFTAIPVPDEVKKKFTELTRGKLPVPYVNTTNLHVTLNFFGELDSDHVRKVKEVFREVCTARNSFEIKLDKIKAFHNRQLHLTLQPNPALANLQRELEASFRSKGFVFQDREYYPHIKLANMHMDNVMNRDRKIENFPHEELQQLNFRAAKIILYESKLLLHHPQHIPIMEIDLK